MKQLNKTGLIFVGDTHGYFDGLKNIAQEVSDFAIVHVGDVGLGFNSLKTELEILTKKLQPHYLKNNNDLIFLRGNHDSKQRFAELRKENLQNIYFPKDYETYSINNKTIMFIGGAISVDRCGRTPGVSYWSDEKVVLNEDKCQKCDILVTHTAPSWCFPQSFGDIVYGWAKEDSYLIEDLTNERSIVDKIFNICQPSYHVYGHFHSSWSETINNCEHRLLDINEFWEFKKL